MASSNKKPKLSSLVEEHLLCPVCYTIPRSGPVRQCHRGHIVCHECYNKIKVVSVIGNLSVVYDSDPDDEVLKNCPTCREPIKGFSLIAGSKVSEYCILVWGV